jgi:glutamyl-tRNA synthetase
MAEQARFYFTDEIVLDEAAAKKFLKGNILEPLKAITAGLTDLPELSEEKLEKLFTDVMSGFELKLGKIAQPVRVALTGTSVSPGIFEIIEVLGKERVISRLQKAIEYIEKRQQEG